MPSPPPPPRLLSPATSTSPLSTSLYPPSSSSPSLLPAIHLIADSIAQQRQLASSFLITHPLTLSALFAVLAAAAQYLLSRSPNGGGGGGGWGVVITTWTGIVMALLVGVRWMVGGYLEVAEGVGRGWLRGGDEVLVTTIEEEVIAVVVFRVEVEEGRAESRSRGFIRAWTVRLRQRGVGLGRTSLDVVVRICMQERGCESVEFEEEHANAAKVLPPFLHARFVRRREEKARRLLDEFVKGAQARAREDAGAQQQQQQQQ